MIRTRDFLLFGIAVLFIFAGINTTIFLDNFNTTGQGAAAITFDQSTEMVGAETVSPKNSREATVSRLKNKLAQGEGKVSGGPVFTSVDDLATSSADVVTDQTTPTSVWIGHTLDGLPLMSEDLWRFVGFSQNDQVGVALNDFPIYGVRSDGASLDSCGGVDEGLGYRYYIQPGKEIAEGCFGQ